MRIIKHYLVIFLIIIGCESENTNFIEGKLSLLNFKRVLSTPVFVLLTVYP